MRYEMIQTHDGRYDIVDRGNPNRSDHVMCNAAFEDATRILAALEATEQDT